MRQSSRLIFNSIAVYVRMVITVGVTVFVTRLVLKAIGIEDYGLLSLLGAGGGILLIINDALIGGAQRQLAFELGKNDIEQLRIVFNTSLGLFFFGGVAVLVIGSSLICLIDKILQIPIGREGAAGWVFFFTILMLTINVWVTPFNALLAANQDIAFCTVFEITQVILQFGAALLLFVLPGDRLITYSALLLCASTLLGSGIIAVCIFRYQFAKPTMSLFRWSEIKRICCFAGWGLLGGVTWRLFMQGSVIILNIFFGTAVNAAYAIALQVNSYQNSLAQPIRRAVQPAIVSLEAKDERLNLRLLTLLSSKYQVLMMLFFAIPIIIDTENMLGLWLQNTPPHTAMMVRWLLLGSVFFYLTNGYDMVVIATGRLANYTISATLTNLLCFLAPIAIFSVFQVGPWVLPASFAIITIVTAPLRAWQAGSQIDLPIMLWIKEVLVPMCSVAMIGMLPALSIRLTMHEGWARLISIFVAFDICAAIFIWSVVLQEEEKKYFTCALNRITKYFPYKVAPDSEVKKGCKDEPKG